MLKILPFASYREGFVGSLFLTCRVITRHNLRNQSMAGKNAENAEKIVPAELDHENSKMREQNNKLVEELMEQKNNVNKLVAFSRGLLQRAIAKDNEEICTILLDAKANLEEVLHDYHNDNDGLRPLHMACRLGKENLAKMLIQAGANVNAQDDDYFTSLNCAPLHCATEKGHIGICEMLLNNGANIEAEDGDGHTALHVSCATGNVDVVCMLIKRKANVKATGQKGETPLHLVCASVKIIELLHQNGAEMDSKDENGNTPLHYAYMFGNDEHSDVVDVLIRLGANPTAKNNKGKMPNEMEKATKYGIKDLNGFNNEYGYKGRRYVF